MLQTQIKKPLRMLKILQWCFSIFQCRYFMWFWHFGNDKLP